MTRIVHLALKVDDLEKTTEFYEKVFGFWEAETRKTRDHLSRHLTDGEIDFTLIKYDEGTDSAESKASGEKPYHTESSEHWTLIDYVNIVVHIFNREQRKFYDLESLWADADSMEHND